jgi:hypothetical protein
VIPPSPTSREEFDRFMRSQIESLGKGDQEREHSKAIDALSVRAGPFTV